MCSFIVDNYQNTRYNSSKSSAFLLILSNYIEKSKIILQRSHQLPVFLQFTKIVKFRGSPILKNFAETSSFKVFKQRSTFLKSSQPYYLNRLLLYLIDLLMILMFDMFCSFRKIVASKFFHGYLVSQKFIMKKNKGRKILQAWVF